MVPVLNIPIVCRDCFRLCTNPSYIGRRVVLETYERTNDNPVYSQAEKVNFYLQYLGLIWKVVKKYEEKNINFVGRNGDYGHGRWGLCYNIVFARC